MRDDAGRLGNGGDGPGSLLLPALPGFLILDGLPRNHYGRAVSRPFAAGFSGEPAVPGGPTGLTGPGGAVTLNPPAPAA